MPAAWVALNTVIICLFSQKVEDSGGPMDIAVDGEEDIKSYFYAN